METTSVIILNGFLGAGKTTLLKNLLIQAHEKQLSVSVIVNDMSELDVDGVLIANTDIVDAKDNNFVSITADSISSPAGLKKMDLAINHLLDHNKPDVMLIETSGSSHPLPLVKYLRRHSRVRLKAFLTLVDTVMLHEDYNDGKKLIPTLQENLRHNKRGLENLLAEQIRFCNRLLLTRNDRLPFDIISAVAKAIHPLNPSVDVLAVSWGNIELSTLLAIPDYNFDRVELLISELEALVGNMDTPCNNEELIWRVIRDDRPFHPQRLWDTCHRFMGMGVYRSKGFFWLPGRDDLALLWNQSAGSISLALIGYWKAGVLEHTDNNLTREERSALQRHIDTASGRFGDRCCQLTIIGNATEVNDFTHALSLCLLTEEEIQWWMSGGVFPDPWPQKVTRLS